MASIRMMIGRYFVFDVFSDLMDLRVIPPAQDPFGGFIGLLNAGIGGVD